MNNSTLPIEEIVQECFNSHLGQQLDELFTTSDKRVFIRYKEAKDYSNHLEDKSILHWFEEWNGQDPIPILRNELLD